MNQVFAFLAGAIFGILFLIIVGAEPPHSSQRFLGRACTAELKLAPSARDTLRLVLSDKECAPFAQRNSQ